MRADWCANESMHSTTSCEKMGNGSAGVIEEATGSNVTPVGGEVECKVGWRNEKISDVFVVLGSSIVIFSPVVLPDIRVTSSQIESRPVATFGCTGSIWRENVEIGAVRGRGYTCAECNAREGNN